MLYYTYTVGEFWRWGLDWGPEAEAGNSPGLFFISRPSAAVPFLPSPSSFFRFLNLVSWKGLILLSFFCWMISLGAKLDGHTSLFWISLMWSYVFFPSLFPPCVSLLSFLYLRYAIQFDINVGKGGQRTAFCPRCFSFFLFSFSFSLSWFGI